MPAQAGFFNQIACTVDAKNSPNSTIAKERCDRCRQIADTICSS